MKVKELREILSKVDDDVDVFYERIEDVYFKENGWKASLKVLNDMGEGFEDEYIRPLGAFIYKNNVLIYTHY